MDLPMGQIIEGKLVFKEIKPKEKIASLMETNFFGYAVITIEGASGVEEGAAIISQNRVTGAIFDYLRFGKKVFGDIALVHFLNALRAENGIMDIVALNRQQIELIIAFNEKIELSKQIVSKDFLKAGPEKYDSSLAKTFLAKELEKKESRTEIFKKIGLAEFSRKI